MIVTGDGGFGVISNQFGFSIDGLPGWTVVVERSSDLRLWSPLKTNVLGTSRLYFGDLDWWQNPQQFYRVRLGP